MPAGSGWSSGLDAGMSEVSLMMKQIGRELSHHSRPVNGSAIRRARLACLHLSPFQQGPLRETSTILASTRTARRSQYRSSMAFLIDNSTLTRASEGDPAALTRLATMLRPHIEKQLLRYPVTDEDRRDLVQATLMQVIRRVGSFRGDASFSTWLFRVTANEALMLMRSQRRHRTRVVGGLDLEDLGNLPAATAAASERDARVRQALEELPSSYRDVVALHYNLDLGLHEIAARLSTTESAVRSRLHRARSRLRAILERGALGHEIAAA